MNLYGWDVVSVVSAARLNEVLAEAQASLITSFDFDQGGLHLRGTFGPWQIAPGGSNALLNLELPLAQAVASGLPGSTAEVDVSGLSVLVQVALKLLTDAGGTRKELRFDFSGAGHANGKAVTFIQAHDPQGRLSEFARMLLGEGVAACVSAHGDSVAFVFARVGGASPDAAWLAPADSNWCYSETVQREPYLALLSVSGSRTASGLPRTVDPGALLPGLNALLGISRREILEGALLPYLRQSWFSDMKPRLSGDRIASTKAKQLPTQKRWPFSLTPFVDVLTVGVDDGALVSTCGGHGDLSLGMRLDYTISMTMPFVFDSSRKTVRFDRDSKPKVTYTAHLPGVLDTLVGWFVRWILSFFTGQISTPIQNAAVAVQGMMSPPIGVIGWLGVRFNVTDAALSDCLIFRDR